MAAISGTTRPAYVYDAANNQWVPIGVGPHTHSLADLPAVVSTNGGSTITAQGPTIKGLVIQGASGQSANLFDVQKNDLNSSLMVSPVGLVGINTGTPAAALDVNGVIISRSQLGIGGTPTTNAKLDVYGDDARVRWELLSSKVVEVTTNSAANAYRDKEFDAASHTFKTNGGDKVKVLSSGNVGIGTTTPDKKLTVEGGEFNLGWMRSWNVGQPTGLIVSGGTNCIRILVNRNANYFRGFMFDVYGGGGLDWGGNGLTTYFAKFMVTFQNTDTGRVHLIQEFGRSYLNNSGTEVTYNTFTATLDSNYYYLTLNFKGINATLGYRPYFFVTTYDPGNGGGSAVATSNNQVFNVQAI